MTDMSMKRRSLILGAGGLALPWVAKAQGALAAAKVSVGRIPWSAYNSPLTQYMINNKLYEKRAAELGFDLTVDWRDYPTALPMVEAVVGNNLDMGMWGNTPIIRGIAAKLPISLLNVGEGHLRLVLCTRQGSPVRTIEDIKGKTVGALLGGDPYNALTQMLRWELGSANPRDLGIKIVNTPTLAQAAQVPSGLDAAISVYPAYLAAQSTGTVGIMNSFGTTEDYYKGPAGEGGGHLLPAVRKSPFFPDGYYLHRSFWLVNNGLLDRNPKLVLAFVMAQQDSLAALTAMKAGDVSQLVKDYWKLDPDQGTKVVNDDVLEQRAWLWPTEGDARAVLETSKYLVDSKMIPAPLTWAQVKASFERTAPIVKEAYERLGRKPADSEFTRKDVTDLRGRPVWEIDRWSDLT